MIRFIMKCNFVVFFVDAPGVVVGQRIFSWLWGVQHTTLVDVPGIRLYLKRYGCSQVSFNPCS